MAKNSLLDWSATAASNTDVGGIDIGEGCPAANVNNAMREIMAQVKSGVDYKVVPVTKGAGYTAVLTDNNAIIRFSAAATLSLTAAATLGANWHVTVVADGGDVVIDPNSTETINGATTITIPNGTSTIVWCTGSDFLATKDYATKANALQPTVDVASATTTDIGAAASENVRITGTTTITGLGTVAEGTLRFVRMEGALTLTHNGTSLILPGAANITTAANDCFIARSLGSGNWIVLFYQKASGLPVVGGWTEVTPTATTSGSAIDWTSIPSTVTDIEMWFNGVSTTGTDSLVVQLGTGGSPTTSGYASGSGLTGSTSGTRVSATNGMIILSAASTHVLTGLMTLHRTTGNTWISSHSLTLETSVGTGCNGGGSVSLAGALDNVRLTRQTGSQTFDAGSVQLRYR